MSAKRRNIRDEKRDEVAMEIAAIRGRLDHLTEHGARNSASFTRFVLAQVLEGTGRAMQLLSDSDWGFRAPVRNEPRDKRA